METKNIVKDATGNMCFKNDRVKVSLDEMFGTVMVTPIGLDDELTAKHMMALNISGEPTHDKLSNTYSLRDERGNLFTLKVWYNKAKTMARLALAFTGDNYIY